MEGLLGNFLVEKASDVQDYRAVFEDLRERFALTPEETTSWLKALAAEPHPWAWL